MDLPDETGLDALLRLGLNLKFGTGVEVIDTLLRGGFEPGEGCVYELVGEQATGKTQLLYGMTSSFLTRHNGYVVWLHSNGSFLPSRFLRFLPDKESEQEKLGRLERVLVVDVEKPSQLVSFMNKITGFRDVKLVLVDGIGSILASSAWMMREGGREQIECVANAFSRCAAKGAAVVLTNHLVRSDDEQFPALGVGWRKRLVTRRYLVGRDEISRFFREAKEEDEDYKSCGLGSARFSVGDCGVHDYDDLSLSTQ